MATKQKILMDGLKEAIEDYRFLKAMIIEPMIQEYLDACINVAEQYLKDAA